MGMEMSLEREEKVGRGRCLHDQTEGLAMSWHPGGNAPVFPHSENEDTNPPMHVPVPNWESFLPSPLPVPVPVQSRPGILNPNPKWNMQMFACFMYAVKGQIKQMQKCAKAKAKGTCVCVCVGSGMEGGRRKK